MSHRRGFTIVELLVVIGIVAMLLAILLPVLAQARAQAQSVQCAAMLKELFFAQSVYANQNRGRYAPVEYGFAEHTWLAKITPLISGGTTRVRELTSCPSLPANHPDPAVVSYGVNACANLPAWSNRAGAKFDASRIIFMGEKAANTEDHLTTDDGYWLVRPDETPLTWWIQSTGHRSVSTFRHGKTNRANVVLADGHVELFDRAQYRRDSGHWFWGESPVTTYRINMGICCQ